MCQNKPLNIVCTFALKAAQLTTHACTRCCATIQWCSAALHNPKPLALTMHLAMRGPHLSSEAHALARALAAAPCSQARSQRSAVWHVWVCAHDAAGVLHWGQDLRIHSV